MYVCSKYKRLVVSKFSLTSNFINMVKKLNKCDILDGSTMDRVMCKFIIIILENRQKYHGLEG